MLSQNPVYLYETWYSSCSGGGGGGGGAESPVEAPRRPCAGLSGGAGAAGQEQKRRPLEGRLGACTRGAQIKKFIKKFLFFKHNKQEILVLMANLVVVAERRTTHEYFL